MPDRPCPHCTQVVVLDKDGRFARHLGRNKLPCRSGGELPEREANERRRRAIDLCRRVQLVTGADQTQVSRDVAGQLAAMIEALLELDGEAFALATERGHIHLSKQLGVTL